MQRISLAVSFFFLAVGAPAQVLAPAEIRDPKMRQLQNQYLAELKQVSTAITKHEFPYAFFLSRKLDLSDKEQQAADQRSIQFDRYHEQTVLKFTGNYFASYSAELMTPEQRARQTCLDVIAPMLRAAGPLFSGTDVPDAFAFEISHHVRKKVLGVATEGFENLVLILPRAAAARYLAATNEQSKQAALAGGEVFLNASPIELWPGMEYRSEDQPSHAQPSPQPAPHRGPAPDPATSKITTTGPAPVASPSPSPATVAQNMRDTSPEALKSIQRTYQPALDRMLQELDAQAHFVRYAPPAFISFRKALYLQLSVTSPLPDSASGSQYKLAALAFDQHIAHLIRPALEYCKEDRADFDGIDFSTSIRVGAGDNAQPAALAVEFIFPLEMLRKYQQFDATGQQLIDSGFVLINGERVTLNLQIAEAGSR